MALERLDLRCKATHILYRMNKSLRDIEEEKCRGAKWQKTVFFGTELGKSVLQTQSSAVLFLAHFQSRATFNTECHDSRC